MKKIFFKHALIAMGLLSLAAVLCGVVQNLYAVDRLGELVFVFMTLVNIVFSISYAWLQTKLNIPKKITALFVSISAISLLLMNYAYHHLDIPLDAVENGYDQLNFYQKILRNDLTWWFNYLLPFICSMLFFVEQQHRLKSKIAS